MNQTVREWLEKARKDLESAVLESNRGDSANFDLICFLAQQGVEKRMKGALIARQIIAPKTHNLVQLHRLLHDVHQLWDWDELERKALSDGAVIFRYPGAFATAEQATTALERALILGDALLPLLEGPS
jgi:HEPN domain-containing protein